jgi:plastocyanin
MHVVNLKARLNMKSFVLAVLSLLVVPAAMAMANKPLDTPKVSAQPKATVKIHNFKFTPAVLKIGVGETVKFINEDEEPHTVTAQDGAFDSKAMDTDQSWTHTFTQNGTFAYICAIHPFMKGTVTVISTSSTGGKK